MKRQISNCALLGLLLTANLAFGGGARDGGGGAGVVRNGMVMTFGDTKIPLHLPPGLYDIPGLQEAIQDVQNLPPEARDLITDQLLVALRPTLESRQYFTIDEKDINSNTLKKLTTEYGVILDNLKIPGKNKIALFAITSGSDTYLLPDFFKIVDQNGKPDPKAQAAILFHESLRVLSPSADTQDIVTLEIAFENYIKGGSDIPLLYTFYHSKLFESLTYYLLNINAIVSAYYRYDLKNGALGGLVNADGDFNIMSLSGSNTVSFMQSFGDSSEHPEGSGNISYDTEGSYDFSVTDSRPLSDLMQKYPKSLFLQFLALNSNLNLSLAPIGNTEKTEHHNRLLDDGERNQCIDVAGRVGGGAGGDVDDCLYAYWSVPISANVTSLIGNTLQESAPLWIPIKDPTADNFMRTTLTQTLTSIQCVKSNSNSDKQDPLCPEGAISNGNTSSSSAQEIFSLSLGRHTRENETSRRERGRVDLAALS
jgi:hypothetical protein